MHVLYGTAIPLLGIYPEKSSKWAFSGNTWTVLFAAHSSQSMHSALVSINKRMSKGNMVDIWEWYILVYLRKKHNYVVCREWVEIEIIMLHKICQTRKCIQHMLFTYYMEGATEGNGKVNMNKVHYIHIHEDVIINVYIVNIYYF